MTTVNSIENKIETKKEYLQRLIDIPSNEWTKLDHWHNDNKPFYITKNILVDLIDGEVCVIKEER